MQDICRNETPREATVVVSNSKAIDRSQPTKEVINVIEQNSPPWIANNINNDNTNELINHLQERFTESFNTLNKLDITERVFLTKVVRSPNDDIIHAINTIAEERMLKLEQTPLYLYINNMLHTSGVTVNMYLNCEEKLKIEKTLGKRWVVSLEQKINSTRQSLSHVYLGIQC